MLVLVLLFVVLVVVDGLVVVVVTAGWQTEMLTALPPVTCAPGPGFCESTVPGAAPFAHVVSVVELATSPALVIAA